MSSFSRWPACPADPPAPGTEAQTRLSRARSCWNTGRRGGGHFPPCCFRLASPGGGGEGRGGAALSCTPPPTVGRTEEFPGHSLTSFLRRSSRWELGGLPGSSLTEDRRERGKRRSQMLPEAHSRPLAPASSFPISSPGSRGGEKGAAGIRGDSASGACPLAEATAQREARGWAKAVPVRGPSPHRASDSYLGRTVPSGLPPLRRARPGSRTQSQGQGGGTSARASRVGLSLRIPCTKDRSAGDAQRYCVFMEPSWEMEAAQSGWAQVFTHRIGRRVLTVEKYRRAWEAEGR